MGLLKALPSISSLLVSKVVCAVFLRLHGVKSSFSSSVLFCTKILAYNTCSFRYRSVFDVLILLTNLVIFCEVARLSEWMIHNIIANVLIDSRFV